MNHTKIGFWYILGKTLGSLLTNFDSKKNIYSKARQYRFFLFLVFFIMFGFFSYDDYIDSRIAYPSLNEMTLSEGNLTEVKKGKILHYQLTTKQGEKILLEHHPYESKLFYNKETKEWLSHPATVRWFQFPSGTRRIMEVWIEGKQYLDAQESYKDFNRKKNSHFLLIVVLISGGICLLSFISEFIYVKNKLTMEANNGN
jgi:hypothetical protein